jgi:hypothetical protein
MPRAHASCGRSEPGSGGTALQSIAQLVQGRAATTAARSPNRAVTSLPVLAKMMARLPRLWS